MFGHFTICGYSRGDEKSVALRRGEVRGGRNVLVRIQSSCLFGESFHATDCDCAWQVTTSLRMIAQEECGLFIYLFQEGRGIGIFEKIRAFQIQQELECDTVEAFKRLGIEKSDLRTYGLATQIVQREGLLSIRLLTNNESKLASLASLGIAISREPLELEEKDFKKLTAYMDEDDVRQLIEYLRVKKTKLGHKMVGDYARRFLEELDASRGAK
jgi:3,4-dihydroxy 2-butanone 4-phosphate synthase / GTP cyclohydrolase II